MKLFSVGVNRIANPMQMNKYMGMILGGETKESKKQKQVNIP